MSKKLTYEQVKSFIEEQGYQLLSTEYKNNKTKLSIKCPIGHIFEIIYNNFKKGRRCPICFGNKKKTYNEIRKYIKSFNYKLLSKEYKNAHTKLSLQCPSGHKFDIRWNDFHTGCRCPICSGKMKKAIEEVRKYIKSFNYKLLSKEYKNAHTKLSLQCPEEHKFNMTWNSFHAGHRCPICYYESTSSKPEKEVQEFVSNIYDGNIINNDRNTIINPSTGYNLELDVYLPELNKAIEFNGSYWHSFNDVVIKDKIKSEQCRNNNITLLTIHEENWMVNKEMCLQVIENFIN